jgi:seryl-tRNA synthetase
MLLQNKEDASDLMAQKADLEKRKKEAEDAAVQKELERDRKIRSIGNYVHESVPVSNNEVNTHRDVYRMLHIAQTDPQTFARITTRSSRPGLLRTLSWNAPTAFLTTRF